MEKEHLIKSKLTCPITSLSTEKSDLLRLLQILQERSRTAGEIEVASFQQLDQTDEIYEENKGRIKEGFELKMTLLSSDGQEFYGTIDDVFNSPDFPDQIKSLFIGSEIPLQISYGYYVKNSFQLFLDFSKPGLFNLSFLPSQATPNESRIVVQGYDSTWVNGVFHESNNFIKKSPSRFASLHKHSIYDLLVWTLGLPFGFWVVYRLSDLVTSIFGGFSNFVQNAAYVYIFFASLFLFRLLFHYARWVWPLVEYRSPKDAAIKHRVALGIITFGIVTTLIYDLVRAIF